MKNWKAPFRMFRKSLLFQKRIYRQSLTIVLLAICLPTVVVGSGVKWIGTKQLENIVLSSRQHQIAQSTVHLDDSLSYLEKAATQWAFNPDFGPKLKNLETEYDYELIRNIYTNLLLMKESNPLIEQADLYLDQPGVVYSDSNGTLELQNDDKIRFHKLLHNPKTAFWLPSFRPPRSAQSAEGNLTLVYQLPANSDAEPFGALLVYINRNQISQVLSGSTLDENSSVFLFDEAGQTIGGSSETEQSLKLQDGLMLRIRNNGGAKGSLIYRTERNVYSVTYTVFKRLGKYWTYASVDSLDRINSPVVAASYFVYIFGGSGLLLAIATAFLVSRKLYQPIHTIIKMLRSNTSAGSDPADEVEFITEQWQHLTFQSRSLEERLQKQLPAMKEGFLLQLLQGHFQFSKADELKERAQLLGWDTERTGHVVFAIHIIRSVQSRKQFQDGDQELISFAAVNIAEELLENISLQSEIINLHDLSLSIILSYPLDEAAEGRRKELRLLAERLVSALFQFLQLQIVICTSSPIVSVSDIPQAWNEVNRLFRYRDLYDSKQVIQAEDFMPQANVGIRYPFAAESEIMMAVHQLDEDRAARALEAFCTELQANTTKEYLYQQGLLQLLGNLRFGMLKAGYNPFETESLGFQEQLIRGIGTAEITGFLLERVIRPFIMKIRQESENQDMRLKQTIERIVETIHTRFGDADLSLDQLSGEHGLTPLTLSKTFKKVTGTNFVSYVTDLRLRKSKELLTETDYKINDIAEMVGYQPTYFNRIFKKNEGITPSQYRELMQEQGRE